MSIAGDTISVMAVLALFFVYMLEPDDKTKGKQ